MKFHHLALGARDLERVAAFYRDLLGLCEVSRHHEPGRRLRSIWLDLGGAVLMIEQTEEPARPVQGIGAGPFLLALAVGPAERVALERSLAMAGFPVEARTEHTVYLRDPEGNRVALSSYPLRGSKIIH
jgi:glyoxylase I family protein